MGLLHQKSNLSRLPSSKSQFSHHETLLIFTLAQPAAESTPPPPAERLTVAVNTFRFPEQHLQEITGL